MKWEQQEIVRLLKNTPGTQYQEADDTGKAVIRDWVRSLLQKDEITVTFVKADGTDREMRCTLNPEKLPPAPVASGPVDGIVKESRERKKPDEHSLRVYDLDKSEWRSFRFDRLKKVTTELNFG
jgi:WYL_2, Sm-like SH3 beta-barrel fold